MSFASGLGGAMISCGGKILEASCSFWNMICADGENSLLYRYAVVDPTDSSSFAHDAYLIVSSGKLWAIASIIAAALLLYYFFAGRYVSAIDIRYELTVENIFRIMLCYLVIVAILMASPLITAFLLKMGAAVTKVVAGQMRPLPKTDTSYGYFTGIYESLEKTAPSSGAWLSSGAICLIGGLLGAVSIIASGFVLMKTLMVRLFKILIAIPFAPAAFMSFAGGERYKDRAYSWIRTFLCFLLEGSVILMAVNICNAMITAGGFDSLIKAENVTATVLAAVVNLVFPVILTTIAAKGASYFLQKVFGV